MTPPGLDAALRLFTSTFVVADKRTQIHKRLGTAERRRETLETLPRWIATRTAPLEGSDKSPDGIRARFGELSGMLVDEAGGKRVTIAIAVATKTHAVFIADNGGLALITAPGAPPLLCSRL